MNASATIRLPALSDSKNKEESSILTAPSPSADQKAEAPDEFLMAQLGGGNREALAILFRRYARTVRSIAYRAVRDAAEADDLVQDVFLLIHRDSKAFDSAKGSARAWILQIAHRRGISRHRYLRQPHASRRLPA